jgi:hypothetical protein
MYTTEELNQMQSNILATGLPGGMPETGFSEEEAQQFIPNVLRSGSPYGMPQEQQPREVPTETIGAQKVRETVPSFGRPPGSEAMSEGTATPQAPVNRDSMGFGQAFNDAFAKGEQSFTWRGKSYETVTADGKRPTAPTAADTSPETSQVAPQLQAPEATLSTSAGLNLRPQTQLSDIEGFNRPALTLNGQTVYAAPSGGALVDTQGRSVGNLRDMGGQIYQGREVAVVGNDLVDMQGNKVGDFSQAYNGDRDFRFAFDLRRIQKERAEAAQRGDRQALDVLNVEEARARRQWVKDRPKDTTRSWGDVLKGIGLGALQGFTTGGLGGALGGAAAGGIGTAINPEIRQRLQDRMFRMPEAESRVREAETQQQAGQTLEAGRLGVLGAEQNLQQNVIQTRAQALQNEGVYKRWVKGEKVEATEIAEMEQRLGFFTGIKPGFSGGATIQVNGQYFRVSADGVMEPVRDAQGNFVYDLVNTVVAYRDPKTGRVSYLSSREDAARIGNEALAAYNAEMRYRQASYTQEQINARAARPRGGYTANQIRVMQNDYDDVEAEIELMGTMEDLDARIKKAKSDLAKIQQLSEPAAWNAKNKELTALEEQKRTFTARLNSLNRKKDRLRKQLDAAGTPEADEEE